MNLGADAIFTIVAENTGDTDLVDVAITDPLASVCDRDWTAVQALLASSTSSTGNNDAVFNPGETFEYTCTVTGDIATLFPDNENTVEIIGTSVDDPTDQPTDDDPTTVQQYGPAIRIIKEDPTPTPGDTSDHNGVDDNQSVTP